MARNIPVLGVLLSVAAGLSGCSSGAGERAESPFAFRDIERLVSQPRDDDDAGAIAIAYQQKLRTFEAMYGEGVGPAKRSPGYTKCRKAFETVAAVLTMPPGQLRIDDLGIEQSLLACRESAESWRSAAEMATFGGDVRRVASGSLVILGYAVGRTNGRGGAALMAKGLTLLRSDRDAI